MLDAQARREITCNFLSIGHGIIKYALRFCSQGAMIITSVRYDVQAVPKSPFEVRMILTIRNLQKHDVGTYKCAAKNSLGEVESNIRLYGEYTARFRPLSNEVFRGAHKEYLIRLLDGTQSKRGELRYPRRISFHCTCTFADNPTSLPTLRFFPLSFSFLFPLFVPLDSRNARD